MWQEDYTPNSQLTHSFNIQIPQGHCWVSGDNLPASRDSRHFGPLPLALISGTTIAKVLPWNERKWMKNGLEKVDQEL